MTSGQGTSVVMIREIIGGATCVIYSPQIPDMRCPGTVEQILHRRLDDGVEATLQALDQWCRTGCGPAPRPDALPVLHADDQMLAAMDEAERAFEAGVDDEVSRSRRSYLLVRE
ncbi:MAG: hypothetical protein QME96_01835 [Myxococcota bacterium]|nr:hypothetical protein [Myxococcota bacterium]